MSVAGAVPIAPPGSRRERVRAMMRDEILTAAREILRVEGIRGLGMRPLGRAVGVTAPTLYDYFPSKERVLDALFLEGAELLGTAMDEAAAGSAPGLERLRALGLAYRRFAVENPDLYFLIFGRVDATYRPGEYEIESAHCRFDGLVRAVEEAIEVGDLTPGNPELIAHALWTMGHGHVTLEIGGYAEKCDPIAPEELYDRVFAFLLVGMGADPTKLSAIQRAAATS
jgi:AcrR family transcriptional regulator